MPIENLTPWLLLAASIAAGLSGLLIHAQAPLDVARPKPKPGDTAFRNRMLANSLFVLSLVMLGWAAIWLVGPHASKLVGGTGHALHQILIVGVSVTAALAGYWRKRERKRNERR